MPSRHTGEWRYSTTILDVGTSWRWMVSFTSLPLCPWGMNPQYALDRRLGGPQNWSGTLMKKMNTSVDVYNALPLVLLQFLSGLDCLYWYEARFSHMIHSACCLLLTSFLLGLLFWPWKWSNMFPWNVPFCLLNTQYYNPEKCSLYIWLNFAPWINLTDLTMLQNVMSSYSTFITD
jgi:hypothetical protein